MIPDTPDTLGHESCIQIINELKQENNNLKARIERYLWNLGGCSTYALGYGLDESHDKEMALPALDDVLKLAIKNKELMEDIKCLKRKLSRTEKVSSETIDPTRDEWK
jgi:hypothetical protein